MICCIEAKTQELSRASEDIFEGETELAFQKALGMVWYGVRPCRTTCLRA